MITDLEHIGNIPVNTSAVASLFPEIKLEIRRCVILKRLVKSSVLKRALCSQPEGVAKWLCQPS